MPELKLLRLPDRVQVKLTISVSPTLNQSLTDYAALYAATYGSSESVADLIPYMLQSFLDGDRSFSRARGRQNGDAGAAS